MSARVSAPSVTEATVYDHIEVLPEAVEKAIEWDRYWFGYWVSNSPPRTTTDRVLTAWVAWDQKAEAAYVFVDELSSVFRCEWDEKFSCDVSGNDGDIGEPDAYQLWKKKCEKLHGPFRLPVAPARQATTFGAFDGNKTRKVRRLFEDHVLSRKFIREARNSRTLRSRGHPLRIRIGNFELDSPMIYFYVEGTPYLQTIWLNPVADRFMYLDEWSIDTPGRKKSYPYAMKRIRENGVTFVIKAGKLVAER